MHSKIKSNVFQIRTITFTFYLKSSRSHIYLLFIYSENNGATSATPYTTHQSEYYTHYFLFNLYCIPSESTPIPTLPIITLNVRKSTLQPLSLSLSLSVDYRSRSRPFSFARDRKIPHLICVCICFCWRQSYRVPTRFCFCFVLMQYDGFGGIGDGRWRLQRRWWWCEAATATVNVKVNVYWFLIIVGEFFAIWMVFKNFFIGRTMLRDYSAIFGGCCQKQSGWCRSTRLVINWGVLEFCRGICQKKCDKFRWL